MSVIQKMMDGGDGCNCKWGIRITTMRMMATNNTNVGRNGFRMAFVLWLGVLLMNGVVVESFTGLTGRPTTTTTTHTFFQRSVSSRTVLLTPNYMGSSKWDNLVDEDEDEEVGLPGPRDMQYIPVNVMRQNQNFVAIREAGGVEITNDVYARNPDSFTWWFVGKMARISDVSVEDAVKRQWCLMEQHAANLRPLELYPQRGTLELWVAPGDSELDIAYNRPNIAFDQIMRVNQQDDNGETDEPKRLLGQIKAMFVGFQGEVYQAGEEGFRTERTSTGAPAKPELQSADDDGGDGDG
eukprot:scaffold40075_cov52-Attheya_sp.AAC.1